MKSIKATLQSNEWQDLLDDEAEQVDEVTATPATNGGLI